MGGEGNDRLKSGDQHDEGLVFIFYLLFSFPVAVACIEEEVEKVVSKSSGIPIYSYVPYTFKPIFLCTCGRSLEEEIYTDQDVPFFSILLHSPFSNQTHW